MPHMYTVAVPVSMQQGRTMLYLVGLSLMTFRNHCHSVWVCLVLPVGTDDGFILK